MPLFNGGEVGSTSKITIPLIISITTFFSGIAGVYVAVKIDDAQQNVRIQRLEETAETLRSEIKSLDSEQGKLRSDISTIASKADRAGDALDRLDKTMKEVGKSLSDMAVTLGRVDERLRTIEKRR